MKPLHAVFAILAFAFCVLAVAPPAAEAVQPQCCVSEAPAEGSGDPSATQRVPAVEARAATPGDLHPARGPVPAAGPSLDPPHRPPD